MNKQTKITLSADDLQRRKLELEILEAEVRLKALAETQRLERQKIKQDILEKKLANEANERTKDIEIQKATLEIKEKEFATGHAIQIWEVLKYLAVVVPILLTAVGLYVNYKKETAAFQHQIELEQKFKIDAQAVPLLKNLGDSSSAAAVVHAAWALESYGPSAIRLLAANLLLDYPRELYPFFVESLVNIVASAPNDPKEKLSKQDLSNEVIRRIVSQAGWVVYDFIALPSDALKRTSVKAHFNALLQIANRCESVCDVMRTSLKSQMTEVKKLTGALEGHQGDLDSDLQGLVKQVNALLTSL